MLFGKKPVGTETKPITVGRNDPCHCGSKKKYKKCCEAKDETSRHQTLENQWQKSQKEFEKKKEDEAKEAGTAIPGATAPGTHATGQVNQPKHTTFVTPKYNMPRRSGGG